MKNSSRISLNEISKITGISRVTISKVINNKGDVSQSTIQKVKEALKTYNYIPNNNARNLARNKRYTIGYIGFKHYSATYFSENVKKGFVRAIEEFGDSGLDIVIRESNFNEPQDQIKNIDELLDQGITSFIISVIDAELIRDKINDLRKRKCKIIYLNTYVEESDYILVGIDSYQSGVLAAEIMGKMLANGGKVQIITNSNLKKEIAVKMRLDGFMYKIQEYKNIELLPVKIEINTSSKLREFINNLLKTEKDLAGIFDITYMIDVIADTLIKLGQQNNIRLIGFDLFDNIIGHVKKSVIDAIIGQDLSGQAYLASKLMFNDLCYGSQIYKKKFFSRLDVIVSSNMDYFE